MDMPSIKQTLDMPTVQSLLFGYIEMVPAGLDVSFTTFFSAERKIHEDQSTSLPLFNYFLSFMFTDHQFLR